MGNLLGSGYPVQLLSAGVIYVEWIQGSGTKAESRIHRSGE